MSIMFCPNFAFAQKFSKEGTVWASDCHVGTLIRTIARASNGELYFFVWSTPVMVYPFSPFKITRIVEKGDQITFSYVNQNSKETINQRVSIQNGQWRTLDISENGVSIVENGVNISERRNTPTLNQCPINSRAYFTVYPSSANQNNPSDNEKNSIRNIDEIMRICKNKIEHFENQCVLAGNISECMRIKGRGVIEYRDSSTSYFPGWKCI